MKIALIGNPNVGKSVIFNALTGSYVTVSNYPGTTVEIARGPGKFGNRGYTIIDTPGVNSLKAHSEDEKVTADILSKSDVTCVIQVADSKNLRRSLNLTLELARLNLPTILNLNMSDEARERGIRIDTNILSARLGIDVIKTVAVTGDGIARLKEAVARARVPQIKVDTPEGAIDPVKGWENFSHSKKSRILDILTKDVLYISKTREPAISEAIGRMSTRPVTGIPILAAVLIVLYIFVGRFAAMYGVDFFKETIFGGYINPFFTALIDKFIPIGLVKDFLVGEYGLITMAITYAFAIIFPIVTAFFLFFGILEDSGYLPRLSVLSDRIFRVIGLNGRAVLPVVLGLGCGTMATLTTRILDTKKERILVTLLLALTIPCSAQLGVIMGMLGAISGKAVLLWFGILMLVTIIVGLAASKIVPGGRSPFIQELPPMRLPQVTNILAKTLARLKWYLKEAVPLFLLGTAILFVFDKTGILKIMEWIMKPVVTHFLSLPEGIAKVFILGFLRRDYGAAGLYVMARNSELDKIQILVSVIVITLFVPCIAQFFVAIKERGLKIAALIGAFVFVTAFLIGGILNFLLRYLAITF